MWKVLWEEGGGRLLLNEGGGVRGDGRLMWLLRTSMGNLQSEALSS